eukprot:TRINITY_DN57189_c0_g1_i1.p1 TRINITY_DN57189_c0_g1~~TRINITY_DN57189_c0_g1_i1.p1  ORF type:complete len:244 (+),score=22.67 TRINITY_DN57189_c0_g1_i1:203-934(+)
MLEATLPPLYGGILAGVLHTVLGPDHLCALLTLSSCQGIKAFWVGVKWASGHFAGMVVSCAIMVLLNSSVRIEHTHAYHRVMDLAVGVLLVGFGGYFIYFSDHYIDSSWKGRSSSCCHSETASLLPKSDELHEKDKALRSSWGAAAMGMLQGALCPSGFVGLVFMKDYMLKDMVIFAGTFFVVCSVAMGTLSATYGVVTKEFATKRFEGYVFFGSSCCSVLVGVGWIVLNLCGIATHKHHHMQ